MTEIWGQEMEGRSVLDVGGYDGRNAIAALEAGASFARVIDNGEWCLYGWPEPHLDVPLDLVQGRFEFVASDLMDWHDPADVVLAINVIYHCRDHRAALARLIQLAREALVIRTSFVPDDTAGLTRGWLLYPDGSGHENGTVWARPTQAALRAELEKGGVVQEIPTGGANDEVTYHCRRVRP